MLTALTQYIPIQSGQAAFIKEQGLISNLLGIVGYEKRDGWLVFTEDITLTTPNVDMQLVVMDFDKYSDYDLLPLSADQAAAVVQEVAALLLQTPNTDKKVDSVNEQAPQQR